MLCLPIGTATMVRKPEEIWVIFESSFFFLLFKQTTERWRAQSAFPMEPDFVIFGPRQQCPLFQVFSVWLFHVGTEDCVWSSCLTLSEKVTDSPAGFLFYFVFSLLNFFFFLFRERNEPGMANISVFQFPVCHPKLIMSTPSALFSVSPDFPPLFDCSHLSKCHTQFIFSRVSVCTFSSSLTLLQ